MRQYEREYAPPPQLAFDGELRAVRLDDAARDRETQPCTATSIATRLPEALEEMRELVPWNTHAGIGHRARDAVSLPTSTHRDGTSGRRELECVADEVPQHLGNTVAIDQHRGKVSLHIALERAAGPGRLRSKLLADLSSQRAEVETLQLDGEHSTLHPRDVEQVVDEPVHPGCRSANDVE